MNTQTNELQPSEEQHQASDIESTRPGREFLPAVDIYEQADTITLQADMPGVHPDALQIDLRDGVLTLRGEVLEPAAENEVEVHREFETGTFYRQFRLSDSIDQERIDAQLLDGVLYLSLPKVQAARPRQIEVRSN